MGHLLHPLDWTVLLATLAAAMIVGILVGRKEDTSEDYFLAGRSVRWWGVAGSVFGSNVSANHLVGMMGLGFSVGFAQSHFELGAIAGLMVLCYGFLPVYRRLRVYTLSEYLERRYDQRSRLAYAVIMVVIMAFVQMAPALYIGARSMCVLLGGRAVQRVELPIQPAAVTGSRTATAARPGELAAGGATAAAAVRQTKLHVNRTYYVLLVLALAAISASYTILGGLKAVISTDVIQSVLLLAAGLLLAALAFHAIGGWSEMMARDRAGLDRMRLYLPSNDKDLPWTGVLTGLMALHLYYWGTNQFIVQRTLAARSDRDARLGIIVAGFLKMLIPFFSIAVGVAAIYLFQDRIPDRKVDPDVVFPELVKLIVPAGYGLVGLVMAGVLGAILSSIDSMMNSAATIVTIDIYQRYFRPDASERQLVLVGRLSILVLVVLATLLATFALDPNSEANFFLQIADYQGYLIPGLLVAFLLGMFWRRGTAAASLAAIVSGVFYSAIVVYLYNNHLGTHAAIQAWFGPQLNFFHRVVVVLILCTITYLLVSWLGTIEREKSRLTWMDLGGHDSRQLGRLAAALLVSLGVYGGLGWAMVGGWLRPTTCAWTAAGWTFAVFVAVIRTSAPRPAGSAPQRRPVAAIFTDDRCWAGLLSAAAIFMMYYFY
ncbi:MAG: hypothetical protein BMS9Abin04_502 [Planctomycetia bacterium]|nr:MAG: hypothetical protein BMS9Abin04_502 [Planctomycetia bacterium]